MDRGQAIEAARVTIEAIRSTVPVEEQANFDAELANQLGLVSESVGPLATTEALAESVTDQVTETAPVEVELTPEERERATGLQAAFAEKFSTKERVLTPEDFGVVAVGEGEA
jgi:uncharacterized protein (DUF2267 family)